MKHFGVFYFVLFLSHCILLQGQVWNAPINVIDPNLETGGGDLGAYSKLLVVNGYPAIASYDATRYNLIYYRAKDSLGTKWGQPIYLDRAGDVGSHLSLELVNGRPAISYYDASNGDLKFVRASDDNGDAWQSPKIVDNIGSVGLYTSLKVINGNPAIAYHDGTNYDLKYVRAIDISGDAWGDPITVDTIGVVGQLNSLQQVNGKPAISYYDYTNGDLIYSRAKDDMGMIWEDRIKVDTTGNVGQFSSLQIVEGVPAISYYDLTNGDLKFIRAIDSTSLNWGIPQKVDAPGNSNVGQFTSLQVINGSPAIAYYDATDANLKYIRALSIEGSAWSTPVVIESNGDQGRYACLQIIYGNPAVAYYDGSYKNVVFRRATTQNGISVDSWLNKYSLDIRGSDGLFNSLNIIDGNPAIAYYQDQDINSGVLKYVRSNDIKGIDWASSKTLSTGTKAGKYPSLQVVNGNPAIAYFRDPFFFGLQGDKPGYSDLEYVRASDATGANWNSALKVDEYGIVGIALSLEVVNGFPAISYRNLTDGKLQYIRAKDADGVSWGARVRADGVGDVGSFTSLKLINNRPSISYYDLVNKDLLFISAGDAVGNVWPANSISRLDHIGSVGLSTSLLAVNGNPAIGYFDQTNGDLKYIRASNEAGTSWPASKVVDSAGVVGEWLSMQLVSGKPAFAYYDGTKGDLKFILALDSFGSEWGRPITIDSIGNVGAYCSMQIVNGSPAIAYFDATNQELKFISSINVTKSDDYGVIGDKIQVKPNPARETVTLEFPDNLSESLLDYSLYNIDGEVVSYGLLKHNLTVISVKFLHPGNYLIRCTAVSGKKFCGRFVKCE